MCVHMHTVSQVAIRIEHDDHISKTRHTQLQLNVTFQNPGKLLFLHTYISIWSKVLYQIFDNTSPWPTKSHRERDRESHRGRRICCNISLCPTQLTTLEGHTKGHWLKCVNIFVQNTLVYQLCGAKRYDGSQTIHELGLIGRTNWPYT